MTHSTTLILIVSRTTIFSTATYRQQSLAQFNLHVNHIKPQHQKTRIATNSSLTQTTLKTRQLYLEHAHSHHTPPSSHIYPLHQTNPNTWCNTFIWTTNNIHICRASLNTRQKLYSTSTKIWNATTFPKQSTNSEYHNSVSPNAVTPHNSLQVGPLHSTPNAVSLPESHKTRYQLRDNPAPKTYQDNLMFQVSSKPVLAKDFTKKSIQLRAFRHTVSWQTPWFRCLVSSFAFVHSPSVPLEVLQMSPHQYNFCKKSRTRWSV